jgi:hypothetical protein
MVPDRQTPDPEGWLRAGPLQYLPRQAHSLLGHAA